MIRAVIFDCFGVLASDGWLPFKDRHFSHDAALLEQAGSLNKQCDRGFITYDEYIREIARLAAVPETEVRSSIENNVPNEPLFDYITQLKPDYKLGILSNAAANWLTELFTPTQVALFDATVLSYETGFIKPHPRSYEIIAERLGVATSECVLIDDQERYCTGAKDVGMAAICYESFDQMKLGLDRLLADSKN